jgi:hypothetical protein
MRHKKLVSFLTMITVPYVSLTYSKNTWFLMKRQGIIYLMESIIGKGEIIHGTMEEF